MILGSKKYAHQQSNILQYRSLHRVFWFPPVIHYINNHILHVVIKQHRFKINDLSVREP